MPGLGNGCVKCGGGQVASPAGHAGGLANAAHGQLFTSTSLMLAKILTGYKRNCLILVTPLVV